jgi:hypothetical protein
MVETAFSLSLLAVTQTGHFAITQKGNDFHESELAPIFVYIYANELLAAVSGFEREGFKDAATVSVWQRGMFCQGLRGEIF